MARATIPVTQLVRNNGTVVGTAGTIETTDGNTLAAGTFSPEIVVYVNNTGDAGTVSIVPGDNPPALLGGLGTVTIAVGGTAESWIMLETGRVMQDTGEIYFDFSSGMAGDVAAYEVRQAGVS